MRVLHHSVKTNTQCASCADTYEIVDTKVHRRRKWSVVGGTMASAEHEPIASSGGRAASGVQGQSPWSGGKPPEAESILEPANLASFRECPFKLRYTQQIP